MGTQIIRHGRFSFDVNYRHLRGDEGLSFCVYGPVKGVEKELLRFDCFKEAPHFHTAVHDQNTVKPIVAPDPVAWTLQELETRFEELVSQAGGDELNAEENTGYSSLAFELQATANEALKEVASH